MTLTRTIWAVTWLAAIPSIALAQQSSSGMITTIDRLNGTIVIKQTQSGTVGASNGGATEQKYSAAEALLEPVHAGDRISFEVSESGGKKTITKIDRQ